VNYLQTPKGQTIQLNLPGDQNSWTRLSAASDAAMSEKTQLTANQTDLMQADLPQVATQLSLAETKQTALESVIAQLGSGSLFDKL
jgi:hypothetical protein